MRGLHKGCWRDSPVGARKRKGLRIEHTGEVVLELERLNVELDGKMSLPSLCEISTDHTGYIYWDGPS